MAKITGIIPDQAFELIRNRIGEILVDEVGNQYALTSDPDIKATIFMERFVAFDKTEMPCINISLARGNYDNKNSVTSDGTYIYNIDCYANAKTTDINEGDSLASIKLQRLLGICRAILENPSYRTLGYTPPFISRVAVGDINIADPAKQDAVSVIMGRLTLIVRVPENVELITPVLIAGYDTKIKLGLTDKGYLFSVEI